MYNRIQRLITEDGFELIEAAWTVDILQSDHEAVKDVIATNCKQLVVKKAMLALLSYWRRILLARLCFRIISDRF